MADFKTAVLITLEHEGGFQKNPKDHANWSSGVIGEGELIGTKYGITTLDMPGVDIENLTPDQAVEFYKERYWKDLYSQISSQFIANKLFDMGVLFGVKEAVIIMQLTLADFHLTTDGIFGNETLGAVEQSDETSLLASYKANFVTHAFNIAQAKPAERGFLAGWGKRINS